MRRMAATASLCALVAATPRAGAQAPPGDADVEIPAAPKPPPSAPPPNAAPPVAPGPRAGGSAEIEALRNEMRDERARLDARIEALRAELDAQKSRVAPPALADSRSATPPTDEPAKPKGGLPDFWWPALHGPLPGNGVWGFSSYVQTQYQQSQASADQLAQDGTYLNQDEFTVRRGRLRFDAAWEHTEIVAEIDANTNNGAVVGPKRVNASLVYWGRPWEAKLVQHGPRGGQPPLARLTMGLTAIPFGFELQDSPRDRLFLERTQASAALFAGQEDLGAVLSGGVGFFRYAVAAMNGQPLADKQSSPVGDPTHEKDIVARLGADARPSDSFRVTGGVSALYGSGFHPGTPATKSSLAWVDLNGDGEVQVSELIGTPAMSATPSATFTHWGVNLDLELRLETPIGVSMLYGEATVATNLDRALFVADPILTGVNVREFGAYVAFTQEIMRYGLVGFRFDYYDPNADFFQKTQGQLVPVSQAIYTFSPVVGLQIPDRARLTFEYDSVRNLLGVDARGVPTNLAIDHFALRLQVQL